MAPYSMDLRTRVIKAFETTGDAEDVAMTFGVSRVGASVGAAAPGDGIVGATAADEVSSTGARRAGATLGESNCRAPGCDARGIARGAPHARGPEHHLAGDQPFGADCQKNRTRR